MKKILFVAVLALASVMAFAQPRAIGLRLGGFDGVSYMHSLSDNMMIEIEAGFGVDGRSDFWFREKGVNALAHERQWGHTIQAAATLDFMDPFGVTFPSLEKGEMHWYLGGGLAGGYGWWVYNFVDYYAENHFLDRHYDWGRRNWGFLGAAGRGGIEYDFWFPLQVSFDWRPTLGAAMYGYEVLGEKKTAAGLYWELTSIAISARYMF